MELWQKYWAYFGCQNSIIYIGRFMNKNFTSSSPSKSPKQQPKRKTEKMLSRKSKMRLFCCKVRDENLILPVISLHLNQAVHTRPSSYTVTDPAGRLPEPYESFTHIPELNLWALCCLGDKRRTYLASSSCSAYGKHRSVILLLWSSFVLCRNRADGGFCGVSVRHHSYTPRSAQMCTTRASSLCDRRLIPQASLRVSPNTITVVV